MRYLLRIQYSNHLDSRTVRAVLAIVVLGFGLLAAYPSVVQAAGPVITTTSQSVIDAKKKSEIVIEVPLPIMTQGNCVGHFDANKKPLTCVDSYGQYITLIYNYFSSIVGILAAVMLMFGGFKWITASGNESKVEGAKETIYSSIIALVIVLGSYVILYTINPQLVNITSYGIKPITSTDQPYAFCSENKPTLIDLVAMKQTCDPNTQNCCGQQFPIVNQKDITCTWDTCPNKDEVCVIKDGQGQCTKAKEYCENGDKNHRAYCPTADLALQQTKQWNGPETKFEQKFTTTGCEFIDNTGTSDQCIWGKLLIKVPKSQFPSDYETTPVSCTTPAAKGVCWDMDSKNQVVVNNCVDGGSKCVEPDNTRALAGVSGYCLVKKQKTGNSSDYTCWPVPFQNETSPL